MKMDYHTCYRLLAAIDFMLAAFTGVLWWIVNRRSEGLIRLQFEKNSTLELVSCYKANLRSIGSTNGKENAVEQLQELYLRVNHLCTEYYKSSGIHATKQELLHILNLCTILIFVGVGLFMLIDLIVLFSTRNGRASRKALICVVFLLNLLAFLGYAGSALELRIDPRFCLPENDLRPMTIIILFTSAVCKPVQLYVICRFFLDVHRGTYVEEQVSDTEADEPTSSRRKSKRPWPNDPQSETDDGRKAKDFNENVGVVDLNRKGNVTDITKKV